MRKLISILIAVMMVLTLLPVGRVMAEDGKDEAALLKAAKDELQAQITKAEAIDLAKYEDGEVKAAFTQAIQAAEAVYGKADATLQDVKDETTKLENAITAFKEKAKEVTENPEPSEDEVAKQKLADAKEALKQRLIKLKELISKSMKTAM